MSNFNLATAIAVLFSAAAIPAGRPGSLWESASSHGNEEPPLDDLLADPVLRRLMASDGVGLKQLMGMIDTARSKLST